MKINLQKIKDTREQKDSHYMSQSARRDRN